MTDSVVAASGKPFGKSEARHDRGLFAGNIKHMQYVSVIWSSARRQYGVLHDEEDVSRIRWYPKHGEAAAAASLRSEQLGTYVNDGTPRGIRSIEALYGV